MANFSPVVNTRGSIFVHDDGILKRTTYHVFWMYTNLLEPNVAPVKLTCENLTDGNASVPVLDAVLSVSDDGKRRVLAVVNKHPSQAVRLDVSAFAPAASLSATVLAGDSPDAYNDIGSENRVVPAKVSLPVDAGCVQLAPHSLSFVELD